MLISQADIEAELRRRLSELGGRVQWATELVDICDDSDDVIATVRDSTGDHPVRSEWLVGTDGANSATRKLSGIGFPGTPLDDWTASRRRSRNCSTPSRHLSSLSHEIL